MLRLLPVFASFNVCTKQPFPVLLSFIGGGLRLDPIGWKVFKSSCPLEKFTRWCMAMQVSNGVLHGVLNGEVHEECCMR